jgi:macrolide-specific efflux system membrane fusion protein
MPQIKKTLTLLVLLAAVAGAAYFAKTRYFTGPVAPSYLTAPVALGDIEDTVLATGTLQALKQVSVGAQVSGQVRSLKVVLGDIVRKGQLVAEIDSVTQQNNVRNTEAALVTARAQLRAKEASSAQAQLALRRQRDLRAQDAVSQADLETAEASALTLVAEIEALKAQIQQAEIAADTARVNLGYTRIVAPIDGQVVAIVTQEGQTVNANQSAPTIIKLAQVDVMTVKAQISEADVTRVKAGQKVYFTILGEPDRRFEAKLRALEPAPDSIATDSTTSSSSTSSSSSASAIYYNGLFDVPNPDRLLRISMTAQVRITRAEARQTLVIPASALGRRGSDGHYTVRVLGQDGRAEERRVRIGLNNNVNAQVLDGLSEGQQVVLGDASVTGAASRTPRMGPSGGMRL